MNDFIYMLCAAFLLSALGLIACTAPSEQKGAGTYYTLRQGGGGLIETDLEDLLPIQLESDEDLPVIEFEEEIKRPAQEQPVPETENQTEPEVKLTPRDFGSLYAFLSKNSQQHPQKRFFSYGFNETALKISNHVEWVTRKYSRLLFSLNPGF